MKILIAGAGLAGTCFALECRSRGVPFRIVDAALPGRASPGAAGILNPMVPGRWNPVEQLDTFLPRALRAYGDDLKPLRLFFRIGGEEGHRVWAGKKNTTAANWLGRSADTAAGSFAPPGPNQGSPGQTEYWGEILGAHRLDPAVWLRKQHLSFGGDFVHGVVDWDTVDPGARRATIRAAAPGALDRTASPDLSETVYSDFDCLVCADGWRVRTNPFWKDLAWKPARGDAIRLAANPVLDGCFDSMVASLETALGVKGGDPGTPAPVLCGLGIHVLRSSVDGFHVGSTFGWDYGMLEPDPAAADVLAEKAAELLGCDRSVCAPAEQSWGIRPASAHRLPVAGLHPGHPGLAILNGMGTRGVLYAPYAAEMLAKRLFDGQAVPEAFVPRFA